MGYESNNLRRVPVPVDKNFRDIAKAERRSIAQQARLVIEQFTQNYQGKQQLTTPTPTTHAS